MNKFKIGAAASLITLVSVLIFLLVRAPVPEKPETAPDQTEKTEKIESILDNTNNSPKTPVPTTVDYGPNHFGFAHIADNGAGTIGGLFVATAQLKSIEIECFNDFDDLSWDTIQISIYAWTGNYDATISEAAKSAAQFNLNNRDGWEYLSLDTPNCPPGEYLFVADMFGTSMGVLTGGDDDAYVVYFLNGEYDGDIYCRMRATYLDTPDGDIKIKPYFDNTRRPKQMLYYTPMQSGDPDICRAPVWVEENETLGGLFRATEEITSIEFCVMAFPYETASISAALYEWAGTYAASISGDKLYEDTFENFGNGQWLRLKTPNFAATGKYAKNKEYLFVLHGLNWDDANPSGFAGIWKGTIESGYQTAFFEGSPVDGEYYMRANYADSPIPDRIEPSYTMADHIAANPANDSAAKPLPGPGAPGNELDVMADTWVGIDGLGRALPSYDDAPIKNDGKTREVGIFYWSWHYANADKEPVNTSELLRNNPTLDKNDYANPLWWTLRELGIGWDGKGEAPHPIGPYQNFWDEPLFGYYQSTDKWVLRRHAELLAAAGVDVIIFDNTNAAWTWRLGYKAVFEVFQQALDDGANVPKISFLLPFYGDYMNINAQLASLYLDIYREGRYKDLWYYWKGKPLIMANPAGLPTDKNGAHSEIYEEILDFFSFRPGQPMYNEPGNMPNKIGGNIQWDWASLYPQRKAVNPDGTIEQMSVATAMNWSFMPNSVNPRGALTAFNGKDVLGRTFRYEDNDIKKPGYDDRADAAMYGANFAQQFEYAIASDPEFIFITGWNEWTAGRDKWWPPHYPDVYEDYRLDYRVDNAMPDQFSDEFSRDIEPTKGPLKDHYYYQMVSYIRQYKGVRPIPAASEKTEINISGATSQWDDVLPLYRSYQNNIAPRNHEGYGILAGYSDSPAGISGTKRVYVDKTGHNDIIEAKVAHDELNVYFMVKTSGAITAPTDNWMQLLICTTGTAGDNWEGYQYILNRLVPDTAANTTMLEKSKGGWNWDAVAGGTVKYCLEGNVLAIEIPKSMLGIVGDDFVLDFKWSDNTLKTGDILDFYQHGDTAPTGRFNYRYKSK